MNELERRVVKKATLQEIKIFFFEYKENNPEADEKELLEELLKYIDETIDCY